MQEYLLCLVYRPPKTLYTCLIYETFSAHNTMAVKTSTFPKKIRFCIEDDQDEGLTTLTESSVMFRVYTDPNEIIMVEEVLEDVLLMDNLTLNDVIGTHGRCCYLITVPNSFSGKEFVKYAMEDMHLDYKRAMEIGQTILDRRCGRNYDKSEIFKDSDCLYILFDKDESALNSDLLMRLQRLPDSVTAAQVAEYFTRKFAYLYKQYVTVDGQEVDYNGISDSYDFVGYKDGLGALVYMEVTNLTVEEKLAFFINVYNALFIHACCEKGYPKSVSERHKFFLDNRYIIGRLLYSLNDIMHGVLRGNRRAPGSTFKQFDDKDPRKKVSLKTNIPLIHFALVCGSHSSPGIRIYTPESIDAQLLLAAEDFLEDYGCQIDMERRTIYLSAIFKWFKKDFGQSKQEITFWILNHMCPGLKLDQLGALFRSNNYHVKFMKYDWGQNKKADVTECN